jgi:septum formation protein
MFARHVIALAGSYSNVVGLPLYETANLLAGAGWRPLPAP